MHDAAFTKFHGDTCDRLWAYVFRLVRSQAQSDDIVQESYLRFLQSPPRSREDAARRSYLFSIATNLIRDLARQKSRELATDDWVELADMNTNYHAEPETNIDVARAFDSLPVQGRQLLWLSYIEGYDHAKIAELLKLKKSSIKVLMYRARSRFMEIWRSKNKNEKTNQ